MLGGMIRTAKRFLHLAAVLAFAMPAVPARADWREEIGTLRIGMVARPGAGRTVEGLSAIRTAYARAIGLPVEIFVARDYRALIEAQASRRVHYAIYSAVAYAAARDYCHCVEPVASPLDADGADGVRAVVLSRKGMTRSQVKAAGVAAGPESRLGVEELALAELGSAALARSETAARAEDRFIAGEADMLLGWEPATKGDPAKTGTLARLAARGVKASDVEILWSSPVLRYGPHAMLADLPLEPRLRLRKFLTGLRDRQPEIYRLLELERSGGFIAADDRDYATARALVAGIAGEASR